MLAKHSEVEMPLDIDTYHLHCLDGCEKACGEMVDGEWVCVSCGAPFVECNPDICDGFVHRTEPQPTSE